MAFLGFLIAAAIAYVVIKIFLFIPYIATILFIFIGWFILRMNQNNH